MGGKFHEMFVQLTLIFYVTIGSVSSDTYPTDSSIEDGEKLNVQIESKIDTTDFPKISKTTKINTNNDAITFSMGPDDRSTYEPLSTIEILSFTVQVTPGTTIRPDTSINNKIERDSIMAKLKKNVSSPLSIPMKQQAVDNALNIDDPIQSTAFITTTYNSLLLSSNNSTNYTNDDETEKISSSTTLKNGLVRIKLGEIITDESHNVDGSEDDKNRRTLLLNKIRPLSGQFLDIDRMGKINIDDLYPSKLEDFIKITSPPNDQTVNEKLLITDGDKDRGGGGQPLVNNMSILESVNSIGNEELYRDDDMDTGKHIFGHINMHIKPDNDEQAKGNDADNELKRKNMTRTKTGKIEIELIDDKSPSSTKTKPLNFYKSFIPNGKRIKPPALNSTTQRSIFTDLTSQLQQNDGVITTIERNFLKNRNDDETNLTDKINQSKNDYRTSLRSPTPHSKSTSVTHPKYINPIIEYIDRRVKKYDPSNNYYHNHQTKSLLFNSSDSEKRVDFASTKFNSDTQFDGPYRYHPNPTNNDGSETISKEYQTNNKKPEFSTTKFYNSFELNSELYHHNKGIEDYNKRTWAGEITMETNKSGNKFENITNYNISKTNDFDHKYVTLPLEKHINEPVINSTNPFMEFLLNQAKLSNVNSSKLLSPITTSSSTIFPLNKKQVLTKSSEDNFQSFNDGHSSVLTTHTTNINNETMRKYMATIQPSKSPSTFQPTPLLVADAEKDFSTKESMGGSISSTTAINSNTFETLSETSLPVPSPSSILQPVMYTTSYRHTFKPHVPKTSSSYNRQIHAIQEKINSMDCDMQVIPSVSYVSSLWRGNETHILNLPTTTPDNCTINADCMPMIISWEGMAEIQSGDVLIVQVDDNLLIPSFVNQNGTNSTHRPTTAVYQVTRLGHEHCDITEGILLDITPLTVDGKKLITLYDKDLTEGINLLIVVSELWSQQCIRLKVTVKSDNCGENSDCFGKGICFSNSSMEGYECQCCFGFAGTHCEEIDACTPSPCTNNGICVDLSQGHDGNAYQCLCPYGYTGKNCQFEIEPCNPNECINGGSCVGNSSHFRCECLAGYMGRNCEHRYNECESSPCIHGICDDQQDGFRCFCQPGFSGELCNFEYNECESNPCINGGLCADHIGSFSCKCSNGYTGDRCHIKVDFCANSPCPKGHRCVDQGDDYTCECPGGRNGPDCNQVPRLLCDTNPCANGGTCWTSDESYYCACRPGYTGKICDEKFVVETVVSANEILSDGLPLSSHLSYGENGYNTIISPRGPVALHNVYIAFGTFATAIFIVAIVVFVCHCKINHSYRHFTTNKRHLVPMFGFGNRKRNSSSSNQRHWLSGKNTKVKGSNQMLNSGYKSTGSNGTAENGNNMNRPAPNIFNRHLAMNLENDMYYTVDFSDSQQSPLIQ